MTAAGIQALTWDVSRLGGFTAYGLLLASVVVGLALSLGWRSPRYPRFVTNELHRFLTMTALVFIAVHGLAVAVDPFIKLSPVEILVPFVSHYRPVWMAFGIIAGYVMLAVYLSERVRSRIGYGWWRRLHTLAFVVYVFATVHGLGAGSDARTPWAIAIYVAGVILVGVLLLLRMWPADRALRRRPIVLLGAMAIVLAIGAWAGSGPLAPGWAAAAGGSATPLPGPAAPTSQSQASQSQAVSSPASPSPSTQPIALPFEASLRGTAKQTGDGGGTLVLDARMTGAVGGRLEASIPLGEEDAAAPLTLTVDPSGATCQGALTFARRNVLGGTCSLPDGRILAIQMQVALDQGGALVGAVQVSGGQEPATTGPG